MAQEGPSDRTRPAVPPEAAAEWLVLCQVLDECGPVPCQDGRAEDWWPDAKAARSGSTLSAVESCCACPAADACLSYALAADERFGIWGATTPDQRRALRWSRLEHQQDV